LAQKIGSSARAVGNACRDNPYPVIIPCHRVVSVSGMGGYCGHTAGDFMAIKSKLLDYEALFKP
jgi:methylated-DNA-[protein]-cysteine S-methyltransferase